MIKQSDSLEFLKQKKDYEYNIIYADPPYALGSDIIIKENGKPDYKKAVDFMSKWEMPTGEYWEQWFKEAYRVLKHGGYCILFGIDRQDFMFKYYANLSGLKSQQSLYWYFISNFPKSAYLSKNIDKNLGAEREVIGVKKGAGTTGLNIHNNQTFVAKNQYNDGTYDNTAPSTDLAKKYDGYKYSIAPLKSTSEIVMIFKKNLTFQQGYVILITNLLKEILLCITTTIQKKEKGLGIFVNNAVKNFTYHQVEKLLMKNGNHIVQTNAELIENILVDTAGKNSIHNLQNLINIVLEPVLQNQWKDLEGQTIHNGLVEDLKEKMDILLSEMKNITMNINLNIELLWLIVLVECYKKAKMFTTSMEKETTTELKTLNYLLTENIKHYTQEINSKENTKKHLLNVNVVGENFINVMDKLLSLSEIIARENVGLIKKQTCEVVMIFQKPYKTGSCLQDTLAMENGDTECCCGALDIDGNRVPTDEKWEGKTNLQYKDNKNVFMDTLHKSSSSSHKLGRYPSQTFVSSETAEILDEQSGVSKGNGHNSKTKVSGYGEFGGGKSEYYGVGEKLTDIGGCSKILHKCDYTKEEMDLFMYNPKVSSSERNAGCDDFEKKRVSTLCGVDIDKKLDDVFERFRTSPSGNNHPTLKPIMLNYRILKLFKTPNNQKICYAFAGSGSEIAGGLKANFNNYDACEINQEYIDIANARIKYWQSVNFNLDIKSKVNNKIIDNGKENNSDFISSIF